MKNALIALILCSLSYLALAQDERYFRQIFSGELIKESNFKDEKKYSYTFSTPAYFLDLNRDRIAEKIRLTKKDAEDWIEVFESDISGKTTNVFSYRLDTNGYDGELFKIERKKLSNKTMLVLFYYFEGISFYTNFQSAARVYVMTIDNDDLKSINMFKGPAIFEEQKNPKSQYFIRNYKVFLEDFNEDGVKELVFKYNFNTQIFHYSGAGRWKILRT